MQICLLCLEPPKNYDECYVRMEDRELPSCRPCWEQLLLDPARIIRTFEQNAVDRVMLGLQ